MIPPHFQDGEWLLFTFKLKDGEIWCILGDIFTVRLTLFYTQNNWAGGAQVCPLLFVLALCFAFYRLYTGDTGDGRPCWLSCPMWKWLEISGLGRPPLYLAIFGWVYFDKMHFCLQRQEQWHWQCLIFSSVYSASVKIHGKIADWRVMP